MAKRINIGIIGAGGIVNTIHIPGFLSCPEANILAICDMNIKSAEKTANQYNIKNVFKDYTELLRMKEIDGVAIATPNHLHAKMAIDAMNFEKHILLEKPIAMNYSEAINICNTAKKKKIITMTAFNYRFIPALRYLKSIIDSGKLGRIYHLRALYLQQWPGYNWNWRCDKELSGTGQLGDTGSHLIDFAHFLVGDFKTVTGRLTNFINKRNSPVTGKMEKSDTDDACGFISEFENGASGLFEVTRLAAGRGCGKNEYQYLEINGSNGTAIYELQSPEMLKLCIGEQKIYSGEINCKKVPKEFLKVPCSTRELPAKDKLYEPRFDQAHTFIHGIKNNEKVSPDLFDGMKVMQVLDAIVKSSANKKHVEIVHQSID